MILVGIFVCEHFTSCKVTPQTLAAAVRLDWMEAFPLLHVFHSPLFVKNIGVSETVYMQRSSALFILTAICVS